MNNIALSLMNTLIYGGAVVVGLLLIGLISVLIIKKKHKKVHVDLLYLQEIKEALGGDQNIKSLNLEQQRIQINVNQTKKLNPVFFTEAKIPAFISGNKITILFKEHAKEIYEFLASKGA